MGGSKSKSRREPSGRKNNKEALKEKTSTSRGISVSLSVYRLRGAKSGRRSFNEKIGFGIYHTGIEVFGKEWAFGGMLGCTRELCGIFASPPQGALPFFVKSIPLGELPPGTPQESIYAVLQQLCPEWGASTYHLFSHNCNHFTQAFRDAICKHFPDVQLRPIPSFINRAARTANVLVPGVFYDCMSRRTVSEAPRGATADAAQNSAPADDVVRFIPIPSDVEVLRAMSVRELKTLMWVNGISWDGCLEKEDLLCAIREKKQKLSQKSEKP